MDFDYCDCRCHDDSMHVSHIAPCCYQCGICHQRIKTFDYSRHTKKCAEEHKAMMERITGQPVETCEHNWVLDGHNAGEGICSKCYARPIDVE